MNEISRKPAHTVAELASARQHQEKPENWPTSAGNDMRFLPEQTEQPEKIG